MATSTFEAYIGTGPAWTDIGANTLVFSSSATDLTAAITVSQFNDGTHVGNGDPGTDQCGSNHANNCKYLTSTTISINGGGSEAINDTNLAANECSMRLHFNHGSNVDCTSGVFYCYDGTTTTTPATNMDVACVEAQEAATAWTVINDDTTSGAFTNGSIGGNNSGERESLADSLSAQDHYWYLAISASPETVGAKTAFDFGWEFTYS